MAAVDPGSAAAGQGAGLTAGLAIEVVYCAARGQVDSTVVHLPAGATLADALAVSGLMQRHPGLDPAAAGEGVGIWGQPCDVSRVLQPGDRIEVYRPLLIEPMEARRARQRRQLRIKALPDTATAR